MVEYLTVKQVARSLGVSDKTVYSWIASGKLRSRDTVNRRRGGTVVRERRVRRIHVSELARAIRRMESGLPI